MASSSTRSGLLLPANAQPPEYGSCAGQQQEQTSYNINNDTINDLSALKNPRRHDSNDNTHEEETSSLLLLNNDMRDDWWKTTTSPHAKRHLAMYGLLLLFMLVAMSLVAATFSSWTQDQLVGGLNVSPDTASLVHAQVSILQATNDNLQENNSQDQVQKVVYIIRHGEKIKDPQNATDYLYACLSNKGYSRADHLVTTFLHSGNGDLITPNALFAFNYDNHLDCLDPIHHIYRTEATLLPLSEALGISIDNTHGSKPDLCGLGHIADTPGISDQDDNGSNYNHQVCHHPKRTGSVHNFGLCCNLGAGEAIRRKLFADPTQSSSILVAWEHANIGYLAEALMTNDKDNYIGKRDLDVAQFLATNPAFKQMMFWPDSSFDVIWALYFDPHTQNFLKLDTESYVQGFGD